MTREQELISNKNKKKAWAYFVEQGQIPKNVGRWEYVLHHVDESLRHNNIERYILWLPEDLVVMDYGEHTRYHHKGKHKEYVWSEKRNKAISDAKKGHEVTQHTREKISSTLKGKCPSYDVILKGAEAAAISNRGKHYYNNGVICIKSFECPDGFVPGMLKRKAV